jgi:hypothetical protein
MSLRRIFFSLAIVAVFVLSAVTVRSAIAGWANCRSDPVVILSNGITMDISADIGSFPWNVQRVDYILHAPVGTQLVVAIGTPTWLTSQETFTFYADQQPDEYHVETIVHTYQGNPAVTANTILLSVLGIHLDSESIPGYEGELLHAYLITP